MKHGLRGLAVALIVSSTYPVLSGEYHTAECDQVQGDINRTTDALSADLHNFRGRTATATTSKSTCAK
jgi:hypothetical protein